MSDSWDDRDDEFNPSAATLSYLRWAADLGAETLGDAHDMLDRFENSNDIPEILGDDDTVDALREDLGFGLTASGPDTPLTDLL